MAQPPLLTLSEVRLSFGGKPLFEGVDLNLSKGERAALVGRNGAGKSKQLKLIDGTLRPSRGRVVSPGRISYPVGFQGSLHPDLTGMQNTRFVARIYGVDSDALVRFVQKFAELGPGFGLPFRTYSAGMKARLSFGVSMGLPFDTYLVDEVTSVGDGAFRRKSIALLEHRLHTAGAVVVSHSEHMIRRLCSCAVVLEAGQLHFFPEVEQGLAYHAANLGGSALQ